MSAASDVRERAAAAERLLHDHAVRPARVTAEGHQHDVAAVSAPREFLARIAELAPEIKALGFRYVALDLAPRAEPGE